MTLRQFGEKLRRAADEKDMKKKTLCTGINGGRYASDYHQLEDDQMCETKVDGIMEAAGLCLFCIRSDGFCDLHRT